MKNLSSITMANGWVGERVMFFRVCSLFLPFLRQLMHYRNLCISDKTPAIFNAITSFRLFQKTIGNWDSQQFTRYRIMICGGWWYGVPDKQTDRQPVSPTVHPGRGETIASLEYYYRALKEIARNRAPRYFVLWRGGVKFHCASTHDTIE